MARNLLMVVPAPVIAASTDALILDKKFVTGLYQHAEHWDGRIGCVIREGASSIPFGAEYRREDLPVEMIVFGADQRLVLDRLGDWDVALLSADSSLDLLPPDQLRHSRLKIVYGIEYTHGTRQDIIRVDDASVARKAYRAARTAIDERRRRRSLALARGIQANGYPAFSSYSQLNANTMLYLDNRMTKEMFADRIAMDRRKARLEAGMPLRLVHSGRLERMKGAHHLIPFAEMLDAAGLDFRFDIYGAGSLSDEIAARIAASELAPRVTFHGPVDFASQLVPALQSQADLFISFHLQSDPSCTYIESLGCGVPIVGYANEMWSEMLRNSKGGWTVPRGQPEALARQVLALNANRREVVGKAYAGWTFAGQHDFHGQFRARMHHLADIAA